MTNASPPPAPEHDLHALLPWYATGRLTGAERARVEAALAAEPALRQSLERVEEELAETIALNEELGVPSSRPRDELFARIAAEGQRTERGWADRLGAALAGLSPRALAWSAAAAALVVVLQGGMLVTTLLTEDSSYQTASGPGTAAPGEGAYALVAFAPEATVEQVAQALTESRASIVGGPLPGGLFRVRIGERTLKADDYGRALEALRARGPAIRTVVPSN